MAESENQKPNQLSDITLENYSGKKVDKQKLIENGDTGAVPEGTSESYGEVAPLHLDQVSSDAKKTSEGLKAIIISCIVFAAGVTVALIVTIYCAPPQVPPHGAVSCDDKTCSDIGTDLLKKGGSAVDAAIGTLFCLSVVQPASSGLGGGGFMIYRNHKQKKTEAINFRETCPINNNPDSLDDPKLTDPNNINAAFVGVPGFLKGMEEAHNSYGQLSWSDLIQPSIELARDGFILSDDSAYHLENYLNCDQISPTFQSSYCKDGAPLKAGTKVKLQNYSLLLENVAKEGAAYMYEGELAQEIVETVHDYNGSIALRDFSEYEVDRRETIVTDFNSYTIETLDAPSGGPILLFLLNVMSTFNLTRQDQNSSLYYHRFMEVIKFSNAVDEYLGDPLINSGVSDQESDILSLEKAKTVEAGIDDSKTFEEDYYFKTLGLPPRKKRALTHTTHVSVIGPNEDQVSVTNSLNFNFGSHVITPSGIILNNQLLDFDTPKQPHSNPNNQMHAGARPMSHMAPTVAHSEDRPCGLRLATGAVGGWSITSEIASSLINLLIFNMTLEESIEQPRIYFERNSNSFRYEEGFNSAILLDLQNKGHNLTVIQKEDNHSVVNSVMKINETVSGYADSRRGGVASVF